MCLYWVLPPLSNSWILSIFIMGLYIALNRTPNIDCYCVGAVPNLNLNPRLHLHVFAGLEDSKGY